MLQFKIILNLKFQEKRNISDFKLASIFTETDFQAKKATLDINEAQQLEVYADSLPLINFAKLLCETPDSCSEEPSKTTHLQKNSSNNTTEQERSLKKNEAIQQTALYNLLKGCLDGRTLLSAHSQSGVLDAAGRSKVCNIIIKNELQEDPSHRISSDRMLKWAQEICVVFPKENESTYYSPYICFSPGVRQLASGKLQDCYHNRKREYRKAGIIQQSNRSARSHSGTPKTVDSALPESLRNSVAPDNVLGEESFKATLRWLEKSSHPWSLVERNWSLTSCVRLRNLRKSTETPVSQYLNKYPALKLPTGYLLLLKDFEYLHPSASQRLGQNLPVYRTNILKAANLKFQAQKDVAIKTLLSEYLELAEVGEESSNIATLLVLPFLLPTITTRKKNTKAVWRPSKIEVRDGFIMHVSSESEIAETVKRRKDKLLKFGITFQPLVIIVGESLQEITSYYVVVDTVFYKLPDIITVVDTCFKVCHSLNASYPIECSGVWQFIQKAFYNLFTPSDHAYSSVTALMSEVGIKHSEN